LEAAAHVGELIVDVGTFNALPTDLHRHYREEEEIPGKRTEKIRGRRYVIVQIAAPTESEPTVPGVLDLFDQLCPKDQLQRVMLLIHMPQQHRPADTLPLARQQVQILDWAVGHSGGLKALDTVLRGMVGKQSHP
jgi:hypothetical protein